jgi:hypothetical protein
VDFAYWWSCIGKGLHLQPVQQACFEKFIESKNNLNVTNKSLVLKFTKTLESYAALFPLWQNSKTQIVTKLKTLDEVFLKRGKFHQLGFKCTSVRVQVHLSELMRRGEFKLEPRCTWVETSQGALCRQILQSQACVNKEVTKYSNAELVGQGVLGLAPKLTLGSVGWSSASFLEYLYKYTNNKGN